MTEIAGVFLVTDETQTVITSALDLFKAHNPAWSKTATVITDKDFAEHNVFKTMFPSVMLCICLFHTLRTF